MAVLNGGCWYHIPLSVSQGVPLDVPARPDKSYLYQTTPSLNDTNLSNIDDDPGLRLQHCCARRLVILHNPTSMAGATGKTRGQKKRERDARKKRERIAASSVGQSSGATSGVTPVPEARMVMTMNGVVEEAPVVAKGGKKKETPKKCRFCASNTCSEQIKGRACSEGLIESMEHALGSDDALAALQDLAVALDARDQGLKIGDTDARAAVEWQKKLVERVVEDLETTESLNNGQARAYNASLAAHQDIVGTKRFEVEALGHIANLDLDLAEQKERIKAKLASQLAAVRTTAECLRWKAACVVSKHREEVAELQGSLGFYATQVKTMNTQLNRYTCFKRDFNTLNNVKYVCIGDQGDYDAQDEFIMHMRPRSRRRIPVGQFWGSTVGLVHSIPVSEHVRKLTREKSEMATRGETCDPDAYPDDGSLNPVASVSYTFLNPIRTYETGDARSSAMKFGDVTAAADTWLVQRNLVWYEKWDCRCVAERTGDALSRLGDFMSPFWAKKNSITRGGSHEVFGSAGHRVNCPNHEDYGLNDVTWLERRSMSTEVIISKTQLQTLHAGRYNVATTDKLFNSIFQGTRTDYRTNLNVGDVAQYGGNHAVAEFAFLNQIRDKRTIARGTGTDFEFFDDLSGETHMVTGGGTVTYLIETQGYGQVCNASPLE